MFQSPSATAEKPQPSAPRRERPSLPCSAKRVYSPCPAASASAASASSSPPPNPAPRNAPCSATQPSLPGCASPVTPAPLRGSTSPFRRPGALRVLTRFAQSDYPFRPIVERRPFAMPEPSLDDQRSDLQRLIDACGAKGHALGLGQLARPARLHTQRPLQRRWRRRARQRVRLRPHAWGNPRRLYGLG